VTLAEHHGSVSPEHRWMTNDWWRGTVQTLRLGVLLLDDQAGGFTITLYPCFEDATQAKRAAILERAGLGEAEPDDESLTE
jgi:hypothetical protein